MYLTVSSFQIEVVIDGEILVGCLVFVASVVLFGLFLFPNSLIGGLLRWIAVGNRFHSC
jgi:hypothetical protein